MREKVKNVIGKRSRSQIRIYSLIFIVVAGILALFIYLKTVENGEWVITLQTQQRQLVMARSGASQIEFFLQGVRRDLLTLNNIETVSQLKEKETRTVLQEFIDATPNSPLVSLGRLDETGRMVVVANRERIKTGEGELFSDRDYFRWSQNPQNRDKAYITAPFISRAGVTRGKMIIVVAAPTYFKNEFSGTITGVIALEKFGERFINPIRLNSKTEILLIDSSGRVLYDKNGLLNRNIVDYATTSSWQGSDAMVREFARIQKEEEGIGQWRFQAIGERKPETQLIGFKTIQVGDQTLKLLVINHKDSILPYVSPITSTQKLGLLLVVFSFLVGGMLFVFIDHLGHRDGYCKGYEQALEELKGGLTLLKKAK